MWKRECCSARDPQIPPTTPRLSRTFIKEFNILVPSRFLIKQPLWSSRGPACDWHAAVSNQCFQVQVHSQHDRCVLFKKCHLPEITKHCCMHVHSDAKRFDTQTVGLGFTGVCRPLNPRPHAVPWLRGWGRQQQGQGQSLQPPHAHLLLPCGRDVPRACPRAVLAGLALCLLAPCREASHAHQGSLGLECPHIRVSTGHNPERPLVPSTTREGVGMEPPHADGRDAHRQVPRKQASSSRLPSSYRRPNWPCPCCTPCGDTSPRHCGTTQAVITRVLINIC